MNQRLKQLYESVYNLALDYEDQKSVMPSYVDVPFEIVDDFQKAYRILYYSLNDNLISIYLLEMIITLENYLYCILLIENFSKLEESVFKNEKEWSEIRKLASLVYENIEYDRKGKSVNIDNFRITLNEFSITSYVNNYFCEFKYLKDVLNKILNKIDYDDSINRYLEIYHQSFHRYIADGLLNIDQIQNLVALYGILDVDPSNYEIIRAFIVGANILNKHQ